MIPNVLMQKPATSLVPNIYYNNETAELNEKENSNYNQNLNNNQNEGISVQFGVVETSTGSILMDSNGTRVQCTIHGSHDGNNRSTANEHIVNVRVVMTQSKSDLNKVNSTDCVELELVLKQLFTIVLKIGLFKKRCFTIGINVLKDNGSLVSTCVNALSLAMCHAGLPIQTMFYAINIIGMFNDDKDLKLVVNPRKNYENFATLNALAVFGDDILHEPLYYETLGFCSKSIIDEIQKTARKQIGLLKKSMQDCLFEYFSQR